VLEATSGIEPEYNEFAVRCLVTKVAGREVVPS